MAEQKVIMTKGNFQVVKKADDDATAQDFQFGVIHADDSFYIAHCTNSIKAQFVARALDSLEKLDMLAAVSYRAESIRMMYERHDTDLR